MWVYFLDLNQPQHTEIQHLLEKLALLWVEQLVVADLQSLEALDVFDIQLTIMIEFVLCLFFFIGHHASSYAWLLRSSTGTVLFLFLLLIW